MRITAHKKEPTSRKRQTRPIGSLCLSVCRTENNIYIYTYIMFMKHMLVSSISCWVGCFRNLYLITVKRFKVCPSQHTKMSNERNLTRSFDDKERAKEGRKTSNWHLERRQRKRRREPSYLFLSKISHHKVTILAIETIEHLHTLWAQGRSPPRPSLFATHCSPTVASMENGDGGAQPNVGNLMTVTSTI